MNIKQVIPEVLDWFINEYLNLRPLALYTVCFSLVTWYYLTEILFSLFSVTLLSISVRFWKITSNVRLQVQNVRCKVPMFVLKFVPSIHDDWTVSNLIGWLIMAANQNLQSWLIVNCRNELQNKHWNFATNIPNLQTNIRSDFSKANWNRE